MSAIKNVGTQAMTTLVEERQQNGPFKTLEDFLNRLNTKVLNKRQLEHLIMSGALDSLTSNRAALFDAIEDMTKYVHAIAAERESLQRGLFGNEGEVRVFDLPNAKDWGVTEKLQKELDAFGFYLTSHPLAVYDDAFYQNFGLLKSCDVHRTKKQLVSLIGIPASFKIKTSKKGRKFAFSGFSDAYGNFEAVVFSDMLDHVRDVMNKGEPVWVKANLKRNDQGEGRLSVEEISLLEEKVKNFEHTISLQVSDIAQLEVVHAWLKQKQPGDVAIQIFLQHDEQIIEIALSEKYALSIEDRITIKNLASNMVLAT